jgi:hypothetical protein
VEIEEHEEQAASYLELLRRQASQQEHQEQALQMLVENPRPDTQQQDEEYQSWRRQVRQRFEDQQIAARALVAAQAPVPPAGETEEEREQRLQDEEEERQRTVRLDRETRRRNGDNTPFVPNRAEALAAIPLLRAVELEAEREHRQRLSLAYHQHQVSALAEQLATRQPAVYATPEMLSAIVRQRDEDRAATYAATRAANMALIPHPSTAGDPPRRPGDPPRRTLMGGSTPPPATTSTAATPAAPPDLPRARSPPRVVPRRAPTLGPGLQPLRRPQASVNGTPTISIAAPRERAPAPGPSAEAVAAARAHAQTLPRPINARPLSVAAQAMAAAEERARRRQEERAAALAALGGDRGAWPYLERARARALRLRDAVALDHGSRLLVEQQSDRNGGPALELHGHGGPPTTGLVVAPDGGTVWVGCDRGVFEFVVNCRARMGMVGVEMR